MAMDLQGKRALVMGLGVHGGGLGVARFLAQHGADVTVTDLRDAAMLQPTIDALDDLPIRYVLGEHREEDFRNAELVVRNPGVPQESRFLQIARAAGAQIEMEMTLFFRLCPGPILGITGTKGKTTTTMLAGAMLREQFPDTVVAGNLRVSALEQLPKITTHTPVVLELSSFVLEGLGEAHLSPPYACVTNISADHLDRYGSIDAYAAAKAQIFRHQRPGDVVVLNHDDPVAREWALHAPGDVIWFARRQEQYDLLDHSVMIYGDGLLWLDVRAFDNDTFAVPRIAEPGDIRLLGQHNRANIAAAAALAHAFGVDDQHIRTAIRSFRSVEHRLEFVRAIDGVRYVNDTTATAPEAAIAAMHSFGAPIVLLAGGADKNLPFDALAETIAARAKAVVLLHGSATAKLQAALDAVEQAGTELPIIAGPYDDLAQAVAAARALAAAGDVVLLAPGCASFGMFRNEFHRGEAFRAIVADLP